MLPKVLAWSSFGTAFLFAILAVPGAFQWFGWFGEDQEQVTELSKQIFLFGAVPALSVSLLLACTLLVMSAFQSKG